MAKTLDQIRATNALSSATEGNQTFIGKKGGDVVKGLPQLVITNGLLGVLAFALAQKDKETSGHGKAMMAVASHLAHKEVGVLTTQPANLKAFTDVLSKVDAQILRRATAETLAYLNYLKRFAS